MLAAAGPSRVFAVLGPTNTGKTHLAIERMLGHATGMIGFPLRLLARENYDRVARIKGRGRVALITGEERIIPANPDYLICTVESMPTDRAVDFLAVDEIQLCADPERGYVFTDRLLRARGTEETMFLGAETIRPLIRQLVPEAEFVARPRFSSLTYAGERKLTRLPRRSAVVAFSANDVYHLAELLRRSRGGTAVVLGALSPRTRNAQVGLYQSGEVDYLVATDAIGMGLNMDIDHVAFARLTKYDGIGSRRLRAPEIAQIAGRAGRHMADGTFGTTAETGPIDEEIVEAVETHTFDALRTLFWRNSDLDFTNPQALLKSLEQRPPFGMLRRSPDADDVLSLTVLSRDADIQALTPTRASTRLLWEVCQIPDFRKTLSEAHTRLLGEIYRQLRGPRERLDPDWVSGQVGRLDRIDGDIDTLVGRIAHVRTWTYISHRPGWLPDPRHWQDRARHLEDRLSDALHEKLTQRFVDRRASVLARSLRETGDLLGAVTRDGTVMVEGHEIGRLDGFRFTADAAGAEGRALVGAARRALRDEIGRRIRRLESDRDDAFALTADGVVHWRGAAIGRLVGGSDRIRPDVVMHRSELLEASGRDRALTRVRAWVQTEIESALAPLFRLKDPVLIGAARGIAYQVFEGLGAVRRETVADLITELTRGDRRALGAHGVRLGPTHVYLPKAVKPRVIAMRGMLDALHRGADLPPPLPPAAAVSVRPDPALPEAFYDAIGFVVAGNRAVRLDRLDALAVSLRDLAAQGAFAPMPRHAQMIGCRQDELPSVLESLGYRAAEGPDGVTTFRRRARPRGTSKPRAVRPDSPFAKLRALGSAK